MSDTSSRAISFLIAKYKGKRLRYAANPRIGGTTSEPILSSMWCDRWRYMVFSARQQRPLRFSYFLQGWVGTCLRMLVSSISCTEYADSIFSNDGVYTGIELFGAWCAEIMSYGINNAIAMRST